MSSALWVPLLIGIASVFQATLNRQVARAWGLAPAALLNMVVAFAACLAFLSFCLARGSEAGLLRVNVDTSLWRGWWLLPGLFGAAIVLGLPWAVDRVGALPVFVTLIGAQMVTSVTWDRVVEGLALTPQRIVGALLAVVSVLLVSWR